MHFRSHIGSSIVVVFPVWAWLRAVMPTTAEMKGFFAKFKSVTPVVPLVRPPASPPAPTKVHVAITEVVYTLWAPCPEHPPQFVSPRVQPPARYPGRDCKLGHAPGLIKPGHVLGARGPHCVHDSGEYNMLRRRHRVGRRG